MDRNAEQAVRNMLVEAADQAGSTVLEAIDYLDDGSPICLKITIDKEKRDAVFDFEGTGSEVRGNLNAPIAVVHSAIIYWYVPYLVIFMTVVCIRARFAGNGGRRSS
jgi:5-oxoprolinase (ATP-hydrolysing)